MLLLALSVAAFKKTAEQSVQPSQLFQIRKRLVLHVRQSIVGQVPRKQGYLSAKWTSLACTQQQVQVGHQRKGVQAEAISADLIVAEVTGDEGKAMSLCHCVCVRASDAWRMTSKQACCKLSSSQGLTSFASWSSLQKLQHRWQK